MTTKPDLLTILDNLERAATALAVIGTHTHREGVLTLYRETGGALGGIAECFIHARRDALQVLSRTEDDAA